MASKPPVVAAFAAVLMFPRAALACSPRLRFDQIAERAAFFAAIERPPFVLWGLSIAAALAWVVVVMRFRSSAPRWTGWRAAVLIGLAALQPAWWMDPMKGDCGMQRDLAALGVAALSLALLGFGIWHLRAARRTVGGSVSPDQES